MLERENAGSANDIPGPGSVGVQGFKDDEQGDHPLLESPGVHAPEDVHCRPVAGGK